MPLVSLGNTSPVGAIEEADSYEEVTTVQANGANRLENLQTIRNLWPFHSEAPPAWVESEDTRLAEDLADVFSDENHACKIGRPKGYGS